MDFNLLVEACIRGDLLCPLHIAKFSVRLLRILGCVRTSNALLNKQKIASCYNCEKDPILCKWNPIKLSSVTLELVTQRVWVLLINQCIHLLLRTPWPLQERTLLIPADRMESMCTFGQPYDWDSRSFSKCGLCIRWRIRHMLRVFFCFQQLTTSCISPAVHSIESSPASHSQFLVRWMNKANFQMWRI